MSERPEVQATDGALGADGRPLECDSPPFDPLIDTGQVDAAAAPEMVNDAVDAATRVIRNAHIVARMCRLRRPRQLVQLSVAGLVVALFCSAEAVTPVNDGISKYVLAQS